MKSEFKKIAIICASERELAPFLPLIENPTISERAMLRIHEGRLNGFEVAAVYCGVCKVNAAAAAQIMIDCYGADTVISAGASGAIYGIVGALFWVVLRHGGRFETIRTKQMVLAVVCYVSYGFTTEGVDAWAHLGGMVAGFLMTAILYHPKKQD